MQGFFVTFGLSVVCVIFYTLTNPLDMGTALVDVAGLVFGLLGGICVGEVTGTE